MELANAASLLWLFQKVIRQRARTDQFGESM
jgi:hypothetical protein